jgi:hypothetical protein
MITVKQLIIINKQTHWRCKMRMKRTSQMSIYESPSTHEIAQELGKIPEWMDAHLEILNWVEADIQRKNLKDTGHSGMTIESILRSGLLLRRPPAATRLLALTFTRTGEMRGAQWGEFDLKTKLWNIPAERMKSREPHIVPLSLLFWLTWKRHGVSPAASTCSTASRCPRIIGLPPKICGLIVKRSRSAAIPAIMAASSSGAGRIGMKGCPPHSGAPSVCQPAAAEPTGTRKVIDSSTLTGHNKKAAPWQAVV